MKMAVGTHHNAIRLVKAFYYDSGVHQNSMVFRKIPPGICKMHAINHSLRKITFIVSPPHMPQGVP
jgi:hypothetical protein